jgi:hypothetical protein
MKKILVSACLIAAATTGCSSAPDALWRGDFESGDLSQWSYLLNPQGLSVEESCVYQGEYAGRVTITGEPDMLWHGNESLNRSEFSYKPAAGRVGEGLETFFGWSFYLEAPLTDNKHEIGYWESEKSYQQMLRFNILGQDFSFQESAQSQPFWVKENFASPGEWHDVALHIGWSTEAAKGFVQVWLDGEDMGKQFFKTLFAADEGMFTQIGFLRARDDQVETMIIDNVREGHNLKQVLQGFDNKSLACN